MSNPKPTNTNNVTKSISVNVATALAPLGVCNRFVCCRSAALSVRSTPSSWQPECRSRASIAVLSDRPTQSVAEYP
eukprot:6481314-Amphidinium_carterae.1